MSIVAAVGLTANVALGYSVIDPPQHWSQHSKDHQSKPQESKPTADKSLPAAPMPVHKTQSNRLNTASDQQTSQHQNEGSIKWTDIVVAIFTAVLAGVSIWQGVQIKRAERTTLRALRSSQSQARASIRNAKVAESALLAQRPNIEMSGQNQAIIHNRHNGKEISHWVRVFMIFRNTGNRLAQNISARCEIIRKPTELPNPDVEFTPKSIDTPVGATVGQNRDFTMGPFDYFPEDLADVYRHKILMFLLIRIEYDDPLSNVYNTGRHHTQVCVKLDVFADPEQYWDGPHEKERPIIFSFHPYPKNCSSA